MTPGVNFINLLKLFTYTNALMLNFCFTNKTTPNRVSTLNKTFFSTFSLYTLHFVPVRSDLHQSYWHTAQSIQGKRWAYFLAVHKFGVSLLVKLNGAKEWLQVLKRDYQCICVLDHKVGEIDPWFRRRNTFEYSPRRKFVSLQIFKASNRSLVCWVVKRISFDNFNSYFDHSWDFVFIR